MEEQFERASRFQFGPGVDVVSTFKVPLLVLLRTPDRELAISTLGSLRSMAGALPRRYKGERSDLRRFFALGGLHNDPFV